MNTTTRTTYLLTTDQDFAKSFEANPQAALQERGLEATEEQVLALVQALAKFHEAALAESTGTPVTFGQEWYVAEEYDGGN